MNRPFEMWRDASRRGVFFEPDVFSPVMETAERGTDKWDKRIWPLPECGDEYCRCTLHR